MLVWKPSYQEFQTVFSNDYSLRILSILSRKNQIICAADVAKLLDIHISTAKKYLDVLCDYQFIDKEFFPDKPGKPTYYTIKAREFTIMLDLPYLAQTLHEQSERSPLPNPLIREKPDLPPRVTYILDNAGIVKGLVVKKRTKARRYVKQRITLSKDESNFMKYLPHPTMEAEPFLEICRKANLTSYYTIKSILPFIEKLTKFGVIGTIN
ncbi:MAG: hypothetical protein ACFFD4_13015 [Candidatus Odinarchaeota archaeon]